MKKSQTLAALALAFSLGVVAPVAGLITSEGAYAVEYTGITVRTTNEATGAEVESAINYVKTNSTYNKIAAVAEAIAKYGATSYNLKATTTVSNFRTALDDLNDKFVNGTDGAKIVTSYANNDGLNELAQKAAAITNYNVYSNFIKDLNATPFDIEAVKADVRQMNNLGITNVNISSWGTDGTVKTKTSVTAKLKDTTNFDKIANYDSYAALVGYVNNVNDYKEAFDAIKGAISAALKEGSTALDGVEEFTTSITTLKGKAKNIANYDAWDNVYTAVQTADGYTTQASTPNYNKVLAIAGAWAAALPDNDNSTAVVAEVMMSYNGGSADTPSDPEGPSDPSNPGTTLSTISGANGNVTVTGYFDSTTTFLKASKSDKKITAFDGRKYEAYDIELVDKDGKKVSFEGEVTVRIKLPTDYNGQTTGVYYVTENGETELLMAGYNSYTDEMVFKVSHFSLYAVVDGVINPEDGSAEDPSAPGTGVVSSAEGNAATTVSIIAGLATALTALGAGVVAYRNARRSSEK